MTADTASSTTAANAPLPPPEDQSVAAWWERYKALLARVEDEGRKRIPQAELDALWAAERLVLLGPIQTKADVLAKLRAAVRTLQTGGFKTDGSDWQAVADVMAWIEAQP